MLLKNCCLYKLPISCHHSALWGNMIGFLVSHHRRTSTTPQPLMTPWTLKWIPTHADTNWKSNFSFFDSKWSRWIITSAPQKLAFILSNDQIYVEAISLLFYWNSIKNPVRSTRILWFQLLWLDVSNNVITPNLCVCVGVGGWWVGCTINFIITKTVQYLTDGHTKG